MSSIEEPVDSVVANEVTTGQERVATPGTSTQGTCSSSQEDAGPATEDDVPPAPKKPRPAGAGKSNLEMRCISLWKILYQKSNIYCRSF